MDSVLVEFSEDVTGVDLGDFTLTRNGGSVAALHLGVAGVCFAQPLRA